MFDLFNTNRDIILLIIFGFFIGYLVIRSTIWKGYVEKSIKKDLVINDVDVEGLDIEVEIPDVDDKTAEGGFYLYFTSPELKINKMMSKMFDKNNVVKCSIDLKHKFVPFRDFKNFIKNMTIRTASTNVFNTSGVKYVIHLSNGQSIVGHRQFDPNVDHTKFTGPIIFG
tara:strand:- start:16783 stop:17289 length:507 start_codon:yes stop_codon:yes gene_type:complete